MADIINILPDSVANQIAAGEVVDRPASAVKELLENALDAGATRIQLIVKDAGRTLIQVVDNGCGMSESDARLCFERHATSKIHKADDLFAIHTMGFRGEALASIAAIAQVELKTRPHDKELGTQIILEGSRILEQTQCTCPTGTSIAVKNLFFNIPARRNFLKRDSVELGHIEEIFRRVALVNHHVDYSFHSNGRLLYDLHAGNFIERISQMFSGNIRERLYPVNEETPIAKIHGYVSKPEYARKTRGEQYLFVNNRFIKHPALSAAVERAYTDLIPNRYYPSYFLHIDIDPSRIDINIHPTKTEVKFIDEQHLFAILRAATKKALGQFGLATELEFNPPPDFDFSPVPQGYVPIQPKVHFNPDYNPFSSETGTRTATKARGESVSDKWRTFFDPSTSSGRENEKQVTLLCNGQEIPLSVPTQELAPTQAINQFQLSTHNSSPAWGALFHSHDTPIDSIQYNGTGLSLRKTLSRVNADGSLTLIGKEALRAGDRIRVHIDIDCTRDFDNMVLSDQRASAFEPVTTASGWRWNDGLWYYVDVRDERVDCYVDHLSEGHYYVEYDLWVRHLGTFSNGICTLHSVYAPEFRANTASLTITTQQ